MMKGTALVITSIANDRHPVLHQFAAGCMQHDFNFYLIGDKKSPDDFDIPGCSFFPLSAQLASGFELAAQLPTNHYSRKNIGYLMAMGDGAEIILESDDDNLPLDGFWSTPDKTIAGAVCRDKGWVNIFKYFTDILIWPRGFPLEMIQTDTHPSTGIIERILCPVQQGLVQKNPDVDAIYRLTRPLPVFFDNNPSLIITGKARCPFNSQHTIWFKEAFPLMYLPSTCSFRMTDIWRSYVAQRILTENGWGICFHSPSVIHERNEAILINDFKLELSGYLNNHSIMAALELLSLQTGPDNIMDNMRRCYEALLQLSVIEPKELDLLEAWWKDLIDIL